MQRRGWDQRDLAAATVKVDPAGFGISQMTVSRVLQSGRGTARTARLIAGAFAANEPVLDGLLNRRAS